MQASPCAFDKTVAWWTTQSSKHTVARLKRTIWRTVRSIITRLRRALGVPKLLAAHGQSRAQAGGHALLSQRTATVDCPHQVGSQG